MTVRSASDDFCDSGGWIERDQVGDPPRLLVGCPHGQWAGVGYGLIVGEDQALVLAIERARSAHKGLDPRADQ